MCTYLLQLSFSMIMLFLCHALDNWLYPHDPPVPSVGPEVPIVPTEKPFG